MKLCNLDTAQALQELGYDGYYNYIYAKNTESSLRYIGFKEVFELSEYTGPPAPRLDDAAYFIRDKYEINIVIDPESGCKGSYRYIIYTNYGKETGVEMQTYDPKRSYEDALEDAIIKVIEIIKYDE